MQSVLFADSFKFDMESFWLLCIMLCAAVGIIAKLLAVGEGIASACKKSD